MSGICEGRVVVVTGGGRGVGRTLAREFAGRGASVVVNDLWSGVDGSGAAGGPAAEVVTEIEAMGGRAVADGSDIADWDGAAALIQRAIDTYGQLDTLVNNAGILRDRMLTNMSVEEWDSVIRVHLRGTFAPTRWAASHWRERAKAGKANDARVINTSSASGLYGNPGQTNYGAAKAGIAAFTLIAAKELVRYGVTVNAIAPGARTRMTAGLGMAVIDEPDAGAFDAFAAEHVSPLVVWLGSNDSAAVTGQVFNVAGGRISVAEGWRAGPSVDKEDRWDPAELAGVVPDLVARAAPPPDMFGNA